MIYRREVAQRRLQRQIRKGVIESHWALARLEFEKGRPLTDREIVKFIRDRSKRK